MQISTHRSFYQLLLVGLSSLIIQCSTSNGKLETDKPGTVSTLTPYFSIDARLGNLPIDITSTEQVARYAIRAAGVPSEFLIVIDPKLVDGAITLPIAKSSSTVENAAEYQEYLDILLRGHRLLLKGKLEEAQKVLQRLEEEYEVTYGTLILKGNLAMIKGDKDKALAYFKEAKSLFNEAKPLNDLVKE